MVNIGGGARNVLRWLHARWRCCNGQRPATCTDCADQWSFLTGPAALPPARTITARRRGKPARRAAV